MNDGISADLDPGTRRVVNQNTGITNILEMDASEAKIIDTLNRCIDILKGHCGPQSGYAMLLEDNSAGMEFQPSLFTRDGIRILSAVEFMSPMEKYLKDLLTYVGGRVDNNAKDGTTTTMLFSALFLRELMQRRGDIQKPNLSFFKMQKLVDVLFNDILSTIDRMYKFDVNRIAGVAADVELTEEDAMRAAGKIAFVQAMSSSGGNIELATAMKAIFEKTPRVAWEFITSKNSKKEIGKSFQVDVDDFDSRIRCICTTPYSLNKALGTEYCEENVRVIVVPGALNDGSMETSEISDILDIIPPDQPCLLMATYIPASIITKVNVLNQSRMKSITIWQYSPEQQLAGLDYPWELMALLAISCVEPPLYTPTDRITIDNTFIAKKVHWHDTYMDFFGVLDMEEGSCLHPFYGHPEKATTFYNECIEQVTDILGDYKDGHKPDGKMYGFFQEVLNRLACVHRPTLRLGGPLHEQYANKDVVQDVQGAIMSSLVNGFMVNGTFGLYFSVPSAYAEDNGSWKKEAVFSDIVAGTITSALQEVLATIFTVPSISAEEMLNGSAMNAMRKDPDLYQNVLAESNLPFSCSGFMSQLEDGTLDDDAAACSYPVAQPIVITRELLKRTAELLMKFINANKIVVIGGVVVDEPQST